MGRQDRNLDFRTMKRPFRYLTAVLVLMSAFCFKAGARSEDFRAMSFNIRFQFPAQEGQGILRHASRRGFGGGNAREKQQEQRRRAEDT